MFHLESTKVTVVPGFWGFLYEPHTLRISTVELPLNHGYETCIFNSRKNSEVVDRYDTEDDAVRGHLRWMKMLAVKNLRIND